MLYILPPPSAKPPSVWDLIINFHRKGCQDEAPPKKSLKFDCREAKKSQRTWCKTSPSDRSHVSIALTSKAAQFHFLTRRDGLVWSRLHPTLFHRRLVAGNETFFLSLGSSSPIASHMAKRWRFINSFSSSDFLLHCDGKSFFVFVLFVFRKISSQIFQAASSDPSNTRRPSGEYRSSPPNLMAVSFPPKIYSWKANKTLNIHWAMIRGRRRAATEFNSSSAANFQT